MSAPPTKQVSTSTLIMGPSATGKSALIATLAEYVWETYQKKTFYYLSDGGGFPTKLQGLIDLGIVRFWRLKTRSASGLTFETLQRACQGWWPQRIKAQTGEVEPAVKLVPPMQLTFTVFCADGHVMRTSPAPPTLVTMLCPKCKQPQPPAKQRVEKHTILTKGFEERGAVCFDGLTSMSPMMLNDLAARSGRMELQGEKAGLGGIVTSGDLTWAGNNRAQIGFAQSRIEELVNAALGIPGLVVPPVFTALTAEGQEGSGLRVKGPELAGQAKTSSAPQWFGNVLETALVKDDDGQDCHALLIEGFIDPDGVKHPLRTRAKPGLLPKMLKDPSVEAIRKDPKLAFSSFNMGVFFRLLDGALEQEKAEQAARYTDAPGTPEEMVFGEDGEAAPTAGAATAGTASASAGGAPKAVASGPPRMGAKGAQPAQPTQSAPAVQAPPTETPTTPIEAAAPVEPSTPPVAAPPVSSSAPVVVPIAPKPGPRLASPLTPPAGAPRVASAPRVPPRP